MDTFQYSVPAIFALGIMLLIYLLKSERIPINIPPTWQPLVATGTGLGLLIATRIAQGFSFGRAIFDGLLAGLGAVGMSEVVKQAKGPPSDPPAPKPPSSALPPNDPYRANGGLLRVAFSMLVALIAFGCGAGADVMRVVRVSSEVIVRAEPCLVAQYEAQQEDCLDERAEEEQRACVERVRAAWKPVVDALGELRDVRCSLEPKKCEAP